MFDQDLCLFEYNMGKEMQALSREQEKLRRAIEKDLGKAKTRLLFMLVCTFGLTVVVHIQGEEIKRLKRKEEKRRADAIYDDVR